MSESYQDLRSSMPNSVSRAVDVRVLSLPTASERRAAFSAMMARTRIAEWEFFDVVPAEGLPVSYDERAAFAAHGSILTPAERSCAASHLVMMQQFLEGGSDLLLVLEDDVLIDPNFRLDAFALVAQRCEIDYLKLYARYFTPAHYIGSLSRVVFYRAVWPPLGTQGYLLSRRGAQRLLEHAASGDGLVAPIDNTIDTHWKTGLPIVLAYPFPLLESAYPSSVHIHRDLKKARNAELARELNVASPRRRRWRDSIARNLADRRLRGFDRALANNLETHRKEIYAALFR